MIHAVIIDDEEKARNNLDNLLKEYCEQVEVVAKEGTIAAGIKAINNSNPDLVFLDVEMRNETGFDLFDKKEDIDFEVIFVTAHHKYAVKAFKFSAMDYLLKPIDIEELKAAVDKIEEKKASSMTKEKFELLVQNLKNPGGDMQKIALPSLEGIIFVNLDEIIRCESTANYTNFMLSSGKKILVSKTIKYFDDLLSDYNFFRVHQSHLINLRHISKYVKGEGGHTVMSDGAMVMVSRRKKEPFLKKMSAL
ncbi:MAG: response regulator transcription factor [Bacteroidetes bacterium]|nr:response regulator transcription factor [Bacteroidota bacterium]